jgi:hypothetical protein
MIHISMKFGEIIFSGSEVTVRTNETCDVRTHVQTYVQTDLTEPNTIAAPFGAGDRKYSKTIIRAFIIYTGKVIILET